ncbi:MAG: hypothetical protein CMN30_31825 [Sandaracinus sp.]|nr:hypothetical protein [Sandaracinus sp.]
MSYTVEIDGQEVTLPVSMRGGVLHVMLRATDRATFEAEAIKAPLVTQDEDGTLRTLSGVDIHHIGPMVLVPAVLDEAGEVVIPAVMDTRHHVNFWLGPRIIAYGVWVDWVQRWVSEGAPINTPNKDEEGVSLSGIELIDPDTIFTPSNVLA